jgi:hypothetical protein
VVADQQTPVLVMVMVVLGWAVVVQMENLAGKALEILALQIQAVAVLVVEVVGNPIKMAAQAVLVLLLLLIHQPTRISHLLAAD